MWYVSKVYCNERNSGVVPLENDFILGIKNTENNRYIEGHYYEFSKLDVVGFFYTEEYFYAGVVNPFSLKLLDYIDDVKIVRSIPRTALRAMHLIEPLTDLYCRSSNYISDINKKSECIFITDIIWNIFNWYDFNEENFETIRNKYCFYIDCWCKSNKYKVIVTDGFVSQVTKMKLFSRNKQSDIIT